MRTKGAVSFVFIPMGKLKKVFRDDALVVIGRKFAEQNGLKGEWIDSKQALCPESEVEIVEVKEVQ